ncbi:hypothetical protein C7974DRAFT_187006 [Boeremia exigua]|uniref:uncharacterized protein n=1 Tax=Boeremia exigua TaxID=749465 RepID=UPI001E8E2C04|nr:uncharacterized protein C7974DRAFT_187006 [Boeremia exigua]KAH6629473.1 hypothetical protein C7974DRAFT_187006 [Boeremia exigua]
MDNLTVYPRFASMKALLVALEDEDVAKYVRSLTLMAEGLKQHEYGYAWAWEDLQIWAEFKFTNEDADIMRTIDAAHSFDVVENGDFIISGQYREMLTTLLQRLPNITALTIRKLAPGEHIPGWAGIDLFKQLSFYHEGLDTRHIFYGDWQYDTLHRCITHYLDDFGDHVTEPHAGPQASFIDDLKAAVDANKIKASVTFLPAN